MNISDYQKAFIHKEIELTFQKPVRYSRDCDALSHDILQKTDRQMSGTTLKRFFGLASGHHEPSAFTLDTLAIYSGYSGWSDFLEQVEANKPKGNNHPGAEPTDETTADNYKALQAFKSTQPIQYFYPMHGIRQIETFMQSHKPFHALVAEEEFEPHNLVLQFADHILHSGSKLFTQCKLSLFNYMCIQANSGSACPKMQYACPRALNPFLTLQEGIRHQLIELNAPFFLIVYNLTDDVPVAQFDLLYSILQEFRHFKKFKCIISCTGNFWMQFIDRHQLSFKQDSPLWYNVKFPQKGKNSQNLPRIPHNDMQALFRERQIKLNLQRLQIIAPGLDAFIRIPRVLHIFLNYYTKNPATFNEIDFLLFLIRREFFNDHLAIEKQTLIEEVLAQTGFLKNGRELQLNEMKLTTAAQSAYPHLTSTFLLTERIMRVKNQSYIKVLKIKYRLLAEFLTTLLWIENYGFSRNMIIRLEKYYQSSPIANNHITSWLVKYLLASNHPDLLTWLINRTIRKHNIKPVYYFIHMHKFPSLSNIWISLRNANKPGQLFTSLSKAQQACGIYFRGFFDMDHLDTPVTLIEQCHIHVKPNAAIYYAIKLLHAVFYLKLEDARHIYHALNQATYTNNEPFVMLAGNVYLKVLQKQPGKLHMTPEDGSNQQDKPLLFVNYFFYGHSLLFTSRAMEIQLYTRKMEVILQERPELQQAWPAEIIKLIKAHGKILENKIKDAGELLDSADTYRFPPNSKVYWTMWYHLLRGEYAMANHAGSQAHIDFTNAGEAAEALNYPLFKEMVNNITARYASTTNTSPNKNRVSPSS